MNLNIEKKSKIKGEEKEKHANLGEKENPNLIEGATAAVLIQSINPRER